MQGIQESLHQAECGSRQAAETGARAEDEPAVLDRAGSARWEGPVGALHEVLSQ